MHTHTSHPGRSPHRSGPDETGPTPPPRPTGDPEPAPPDPGATGEPGHRRSGGDPEPAPGGGPERDPEPGEGGEGQPGHGITIDIGGISIGGGGDGEGEEDDGEKRIEWIDGTPDDGGSGWNGAGTPYAPGQVGSEGVPPAIPAQRGADAVAGGQTSGDPADFEATESRLDDAARDFENAADRLAGLGGRLSACLANDSLTSSAAEPGQQISDEIHDISGRLASGLATTGRRLGDQGRALRQADQSASDRFNGLDDRAPSDVRPPSPVPGSSGSPSAGTAPGGRAGGSAPQPPAAPQGGGGTGTPPDPTTLDSTNPLITPAPDAPQTGSGTGTPPDPTTLDSTNPLITPAPDAPQTGSGTGTRLSGSSMVHADLGAAVGSAGAPAATAVDAGASGAAAAAGRPSRPLLPGSGLEAGLRAEARTLGLSSADTDRVVAALEAAPQGEMAAETIASGRYDQRPGFTATVSMLAHPGTAPAALHHLDLAARMSDHGVDDLSFGGGATAGADGRGVPAGTGLVARGQDGESYSYRYRELGDPAQLVRTAQKELLQTVDGGTDHQVLWLRTSGSADDLRSDGTVRQLTELYSRQRAQFVVETDTGRVGIPAGGRFFPWSEEIS
ncbi:hypothetical protein [Peterkaempfera sp. SMS 1(5)a]|uniref:WXG100 family type VII secretion target n=1 Tax=Peterkaempfera podocarpi TaxID=3232308 RepID=UPI00367100D0